MIRKHAVSVVLVHGGFVDGSGWEPVYRILRDEGFHVSIVQHSTQSLDSDVAMTKHVLAMQERRSILVGHSYGGAVITEAGNDHRVAGLVYIAAFVPDAGESVQSLIADFPPGSPMPPIQPARDGYLFLDRARFHEAFAADLDADKAAFLADSQLPWGVNALTGTITQPAWRRKPSWYLVAANDRMIPPSMQHVMARRAAAGIREEAGSHSIFMSRPEAVADLIFGAAESNALAA